MAWGLGFQGLALGRDLGISGFGLSLSLRAAGVGDLGPNVLCPTSLDSKTSGMPFKARLESEARSLEKP